MSRIGKSERMTQKRVVALFRDELKYRYLGDWSDRDNSNIDEKLLSDDELFSKSMPYWDLFNKLVRAAKTRMGLSSESALEIHENDGDRA